MHHFKAAEFLGLNLIKGFDDLSSKYSKQYVIIAEVTSVDCLNFDRTSHASSNGYESKTS